MDTSPWSCNDAHLYIQETVAWSCNDAHLYIQETVAWSCNDAHLYIQETVAWSCNDALLYIQETIAWSCNDAHLYIQETATCQYGNAHYSVGESIHPDEPCDSCMCTQFGVMCQLRSCPREYCHDAVQGPCCTICPHGKMQKMIDCLLWCSFHDLVIAHVPGGGGGGRYLDILQ